MNRKYEVLLLLSSTLNEKDLAKTIADVEAKLNGNIVKKEEWGLKNLAYEIKKSRKAYFVLYYVETTPEAIASLKEMILIDKRIVRPLILRHEKKWPFEYKTSKELKFPERKKIDRGDFKSKYPRQKNRFDNRKQPNNLKPKTTTVSN